MDKWEAMRGTLMCLTVKQLRAIAKDEGICLGNEGTTKSSIVGCIVTNRRYREMCGVAR